MSDFVQRALIARWASRWRATPIVTRGGAFALLEDLMVMDIGQTMLAQSLGRNQDFAAELFAVAKTDQQYYREKEIREKGLAPALRNPRQPAVVGG